MWKPLLLLVKAATALFSETDGDCSPLNLSNDEVRAEEENPTDFW